MSSTTSALMQAKAPAAEPKSEPKEPKADTPKPTPAKGEAASDKPKMSEAQKRAIYIAVSLATPPPPPEQVDGLTWDHPLRVILRGRLRGASDPRLLAALLFALMVVLYYIFR